MRGTTRCSDHGGVEYGGAEAVDAVIDYRPHWKRSLRKSLSWSSPERRLERFIVKRFVKTGADRLSFSDAQLKTLFPDPRQYLSNPGFIMHVAYLVEESMYPVRLVYETGGNLSVFTR
jgi:hypothetical protein